MSNSIQDTLQTIVSQIRQLDGKVDNLSDDIEINSNKIDKLRDVVIGQSGDIEAIGRQAQMNKKKRGGLPMKSLANSMQLSSD